MQAITSTSELKSAIKELELEHDIQAKVLTNQIHLTYESLKPINLIRDTLKDVTSMSYPTDNILGVSIGLVSGYITKKLYIGTSDNPFKKLMGSIVQFGVAHILKSIGQSIFQNIFAKNEKI
jgi:hypothetical protein